MNPRVLYRAATYATDARSTADSVISALTPAAWYRNATDVVSSGGFASIWADYASSDKGLVLPNVSGNSASITDAGAILGSGDVDLRGKLTPNSWGSATQQAIAFKTNSFEFGIGGGGAWIYFWFSLDGGTSINTFKSVSGVSFSDASTGLVRVTREKATGDVKFYESADGVAWTQVGATQTSTAGVAVGGNANPLYFGIAISARGIIGVLNRAQIRSAIDGTTVFDADFSAQAIGAGSFTESSSNAATVTINASGASPAHIGKARDLLQGTATNQPAYSAGVFTFDGVDNYMRTLAFTLNQPETCYMVVKQIGWTGNDYLCDGNGLAGLGILQTATGGSSPQLSLNAGSEVIKNGNLAIGSRGILAAVFNGASSGLRINNNAASTGNPGAGNAGGFTLGANGGVVLVFSNITVEEVVLFGAAHDDATQSSVITALNNALTVF